jgi:hypothetical protein
MDGNGQLRNGMAEQVLRWPGRLLTAEDVRRSLNGHREVVLNSGALITPLAAEELRSNGIGIRREAVSKSDASTSWGYGEDRPHPLVRSAVDSLRGEGIVPSELPACGDEAVCQWAKAVAEWVASGECSGSIVFCQDPGLVCCVANKLAGLRAVSVITVAQATRATLTLGANLVAVEMPGRTFYEVRQLIRTLARAGSPACPPGAAYTLQELDGHAHR